MSEDTEHRKRDHRGHGGGTCVSACDCVCAFENRGGWGNFDADLLNVKLNNRVLQISIHSYTKGSGLFPSSCGDYGLRDAAVAQQAPMVCKRGRLG